MKPLHRIINEANKNRKSPHDYPMVSIADKLEDPDPDKRTMKKLQKKKRIAAIVRAAAKAAGGYDDD